jgi:hypothetical protein
MAASTPNSTPKITYSHQGVMKMPTTVNTTMQSASAPPMNRFAFGSCSAVTL